MADAALEWCTAESAFPKNTRHGGNLVAGGTDFLDQVADIGTRLEDLARHICESLIPVKVTGGIEHTAHLAYSLLSEESILVKDSSSVTRFLAVTLLFTCISVVAGGCGNGLSEETAQRLINAHLREAESDANSRGLGSPPPFESICVRAPDSDHAFDCTVKLQFPNLNPKKNKPRTITRQMRLQATVSQDENAVVITSCAGFAAFGINDCDYFNEPAG